MVTVIFLSRLRDPGDAAYARLAPRMLELARGMPGFLSFKAFVAEDGERVSIIEFDSLAAAEAWRDHPEHRDAQRLGRERFYAEYRIQVCQPLRDYAFDGTRRSERP